MLGTTNVTSLMANVSALPDLRADIIALQEVRASATAQRALTHAMRDVGFDVYCGAPRPPPRQPTTTRLHGTPAQVVWPWW